MNPNTAPLARTSRRREFLRTLARAGLLAALAALGFSLLRRRSRASDPTRHTCANRSVCRGCPALTGCVLPLGQSFKKAIRKEKPRA